MEARLCAGAALSLLFMGLATPASAQTATAGVTAEVVSPPELAKEATEWLVSNSPGVFTLRIPGAAQAPPLTVTAQTLDVGSGTIGFFSSSEGAEALRQLLGQIASAAAAGPDGVYQLSGYVADGAMNLQGVQMILISVYENGGGSGVIATIMAFD